MISIGLAGTLTLLARREDVIVEHVLEVFETAGLRLRLTALADVVLTFLEGCGALLDPLTQAGLVGRVPLLNAAAEGSVGDHAGGVPKGAGEGIHGHDVTMEEVLRVTGLTTDTAAQDEATLLQSALLQDTLHDVCRFADVAGADICSGYCFGPAVGGVDHPQHVEGGGHVHVMLVGAAHEAGEGGFDVQLEVLVQTKVAQHLHGSHCVGLVLVAAGVGWLGLD